MDNNKINVRNVYIELLNKMKAIEGVDIEYIDRLVALLYEDINFIGNAVDEIMKLIPSGASETDKLVIQSVVTAIQNVIPDTATSTNKLATMSDLPAAQVNSDWNAVSGVAQILNKPTIYNSYLRQYTILAADWSGTHYGYQTTDQIPFALNEPLVSCSSGASDYALLQRIEFTKDSSNNIYIDCYASAAPSGNITINVLYIP